MSWAPTTASFRVELGAAQWAVKHGRPAERGTNTLPTAPDT
jgi:K+-sensing histidine kinase KdpD